MFQSQPFCRKQLRAVVSLTIGIIFWSPDAEAYDGVVEAPFGGFARYTCTEGDLHVQRQREGLDELIEILISPLDLVNESSTRSGVGTGSPLESIGATQGQATCNVSVPQCLFGSKLGQPTRWIFGIN
jgi:hypothetical protein